MRTRITTTKHTEKGFGWEVGTQPEIYQNPVTGKSTPTGKVQLYNEKTGNLISTRSNSYGILPNQRLEDLAKIISEKHDLPISHYTSHQGGKKVLVAFKRPQKEFEICGFKLSSHLVLINTHDGSSCFEVGASNVLFRCANMFTSTRQQLKFRHNGDLLDELDTLENQILGYDNALIEELEKIERWADVEIDKKIILEAKNLLFNLGDKTPSTKKANQLARFDQSVAQETGQLGMNLFGLWNSVTHYTTHNQFTQKARDLQDLGFFGTSQKFQNKIEKFCEKVAA